MTFGDLRGLISHRHNRKAVFFFLNIFMAHFHSVMVEEWYFNVYYIDGTQVQFLIALVFILNSM